MHIALIIAGICCCSFCMTIGFFLGAAMHLAKREDDYYERY